MPPIAAFDIDLTIHREGLFTIFMYALVEANLIPRETCEHPEIIRQKWDTRRGFRRDYAMSIVERFSTLQSLKGLPQDHAIKIAEQLLQDHADHTWLFPRLLLEALQEQGYVTVAISASPAEIVKPFVRRWGFDDYLATELELDDQRCFTGNADKEIRHHRDKAGSLERLATKHGCTLADSIAIGDSMDDFPMLKKATYPFAMNPSNELRQKCREEGIPLIVEYGDSITILHSSSADEAFQEIGLSQVLPFSLAETISNNAEGRISSP